MTWVRIDDQFPQHPKVVGVGPLGIAMQVAGLCYASRFLTDGLIPRAAIPTLMDFTELDENAFNGRGDVCWIAVEKLVKAEMWTEEGGGYKIHDYLAYQPSRAQVLHEREINRTRQSRFKERGNAVNNAGITPLIQKGNAVNNDAPVPVPVPIPIPNKIPPTAGVPAASPLKGGTAQGSPKPAKKVKAKPSVSPAFIARMEQEYSEAWPAPTVQQIIAEALAHKSVHKWDNTELHVQGWLRREAKGFRGNNGSRPQQRGDSRPRSFEGQVIPDLSAYLNPATCPVCAAFKDGTRESSCPAHGEAAAEDHDRRCPVPH